MKAHVRKLALLLLSFVACGSSALAQHAGGMLPLSRVQRILFLGNSITYAGGYISFFESHLILANLRGHAEVINLGLPSETVSGLSEPDHADGKFPRPWLFDRLPRILEKVRPDIVFVCYGMNDGIYLPFDEERFNSYRAGIERLQRELDACGVRRVIFMTPPVHDDRDQGLDGYNLVLDAYSEWLLKQREKRGWEVIDLHFPMRDYLIERRRTDSLFKLAEDGVHPGDEGHWLIAKTILAHFAEDIGNDVTLETYMRNHPSLAAIHELVQQRQAMMKNAWLDDVGHDRPGMAKGLPIKEARKKYRQIGKMIRKSVKCSK